MTHYVLIGSGVAAFAAAEAIRGHDRQAQINFVAEDPSVYYSRPGLAYYLSGEITEKQLHPYHATDYKALQAGIYHARATRIFPAQRRVELNGNKQLAYDRLLLATGARAVPLAVPGVELNGVYKLDDLIDARNLLATAQSGKTALVTGGGITALELVEGLAGRGMTVHYVLRGERYWPAVLEPDESHLIETRLQAAGIHLHHRREVSAILGAHGRVAAVRLNDGEELPCQLVAYAIGIAPRTELARAAGIACGRGILVDEHMQTNLPGIFAAGDVAEVYDPAAGRRVIDSLWPLAREQGRAAGLNMAGQPAVYSQPVPYNVTRLAGLTTTIIGRVGQGQDADLISIARGDSETWRSLPHVLIAQQGFDANHLRLVLDEHNLLGAILIGDQRLSAALEAIITRRIAITPIRARLLAPNAPIADILAEFWSAIEPTYSEMK